MRRLSLGLESFTICRVILPQLFPEARVAIAASVTLHFHDRMASLDVPSQPAFRRERSVAVEPEP